MPTEICSICGCPLRRGKDYAENTPSGRSHATRHHYVAKRFYGKSTNRRGTQREGVFALPPYEMREKHGLFCYECHEELLHNPIFLPEDIDGLAQLVKTRGICDSEKSDDRSNLGQRIKLLHEIIERGIRELKQEIENAI